MKKEKEWVGQEQQENNDSASQTSGEKTGVKEGEVRKE